MPVFTLDELLNEQSSNPPSPGGALPEGVFTLDDLAPESTPEAPPAPIEMPPQPELDRFGLDPQSPT